MHNTHNMHYTHDMHYTRDMHYMHNTPPHKQIYQYDIPQRERFNEYTPHSMSGLILFIARTVGSPGGLMMLFASLAL